MPFLNGTTIELVSPPARRQPPRVALFDFDGTVSLVRAGWQELMVPMMVRLLRQAPRAESEAELTVLVNEFVRATTGQQTILQYNLLAEEAAKRGGSLDPVAAKADYVTELAKEVDRRRASLEAGRVTAADLMVPGAREFIETLLARGVVCYLASGTDEPFVKAEAAMLGVAGFFANIWGARPDEPRPIKQVAVEHIVAAHQLQPGEWISSGDGPSEIEYAHAAGGLAIGVASDEVVRGPVNPVKRDSLIAAGAHLIVPDFSPYAALTAYLFAED
jgi:phosphoglycolate phosphatase-like HAD superfamily hydrolase